MPLTQRNLLPYERPARIYCGRLNLNPDDLVPVGGTAIIATGNTRPRWMNIAEQMVHLSLMMVSMREAIGTEIMTPPKA